MYARTSRAIARCARRSYKSRSKSVIVRATTARKTIGTSDMQLITRQKRPIDLPVAQRDRDIASSDCNPATAAAAAMATTIACRNFFMISLKMKRIARALHGRAATLLVRWE